MTKTYAGRYDLYAGQTPGQTLGPFFSQGLVRVAASFQSAHLCRAERDVLHNNLVDGAHADAPGERLRLEGSVYDGLGRPIPDAMLEIWQADAHGRYPQPPQPLDVAGGQSARSETQQAAFSGFGRCPTDDNGRFWFETLRPGPVPGPGGALQAPHINVILGARGLPRLAFTRIYFADDPALARDAVLGCVPAQRRATLLARRTPETPAHYRFDIHLQGELETVFFDF